ncbi:hypothetical protein [Legionella maioricensis]|uniref:Uncharacterized protein n=1 Tax=Legionella maioricensis TaxID=2896528 RepID=A0A9X2D291_9GAMM|nr:hypothetical protein [Legionella maioricensis]MCL9684888.1 hypothetical protein [Legionella maioricensis]MCL9688964.1 hypothetical protein [Legionella maioricensis]
MQFNVDKILDFALLKAISKGIAEAEGYPVATIYRGGFCITCQKTDRENIIFQQLMDIFPDLCRQYNISPLPGRTEFASSRTPASATELIKYEFYISLDDLDKILMNVSENYVGYRHSGSVLRLAEPNKILMKPGVMCLFPALEMADNNIMLRIAGCNASETISTQLSFLIKKYLPTVNVGTRECYGHHVSPVAKEVFKLEEHDILKIALSCIGIKKQINHQSEKGTTEFHLEVEYRNRLTAMNSEAMEIYRALGAVTPDELPNLKSIEIPIGLFLEELIIHLQEKKEVFNKSLMDAEAKMGKGLNGRDTYVLNNYPSKVQGISVGIEKAQELSRYVEKENTLQNDSNNHATSVFSIGQVETFFNQVRLSSTPNSSVDSTLTIR